MIEILRRFTLALLAGLAFALPAQATSYSTDFTDLWWNPAESGWGMNVIQQDETLFLTFFLYGPDNTARWYVASSVKPTIPQPSNATRFTGALYRTTGPWFGGTFNPVDVGRTEVGAVTVTFDSSDTATLSYTIDGTPVVKVIERQGFRVNSVAGVYAGGLVALASGCTDTLANGPLDMLGTTTVTQATDQVSFKVAFYTPIGQTATCTFTGAYSHKGRMISVPSGSFSCVVNGFQANAGVFAMSALDAQLNGFHATFTGRDQYCTYNGRFGGTRDVAG
ncbi:MAG: hypothetical protein IPP91_07070 [Betaproteobacteria bacterium]|nr:hypothetical protein [Betaproteobacteria bacterium]